MPWTLLIPAAAKGIREKIGGRDPQGRLVRLSICWLVLPFLFLSVSRGKLLTYILPCFPPFAVLVTFGLSHTLEKDKSRVFQAAGCSRYRRSFWFDPSGADLHPGFRLRRISSLHQVLEDADGRERTGLLHAIMFLGLQESERERQSSTLRPGAGSLVFGWPLYHP